MERLEIEIVDGDFAALSRAVEDVADTASGTDIAGAMSCGQGAARGSTSSTLMGPAGEAVDDRASTVAEALRAYSSDAMRAQSSFTQTDDDLAGRARVLNGSLTSGALSSEQAAGVAHMAQVLG